ncbi:hypothetical protein EV700_2305 [Fluviicoccus keumensis]|uniref:DUF1853 family protein n=1 Tax=Fluviicoccus keumensis TaxID=1435465 RepID=A0A4Q7YN05_9GAMM|nr:DUF1853 family protein [Fluviicoccus keumensis]RZU38374.1 hypothetical protein EV700_2305 [Fluviicoccus keumensis]
MTPNLQESLRLWRHPDVRNLAWALASPALLRELPDSAHPVRILDDRFWLPLFAAYRPRLDALERDPSPLVEFLAAHKNHRLGYYFEYLLLFWLQDEAFHPFRLIRHRATIMAGKITVGELDFLLRNTDSGKVEHWEAAVKFYLGHPPLTVAGHWIGPNSHDTLGAKLTHLARQQFRFDAFEDHVIEQRCLVMKGQLFYPPGLTEETLDCLSAGHLRGQWRDWTSFRADPAFRALRWRHAGRDEWLADQQAALQLPLAAPESLAHPDSARPELFIGFDAGDEEQRRCFLTPP